MTDAMNYHLGSLDKDLTEYGNDPVSEQQFYLLAGKLCRVWANSDLPAFEGSVGGVLWRIEPTEMHAGAYISSVRLREASIFEMAHELWRRVRPWSPHAAISFSVPPHSWLLPPSSGQRA